MKTFAHTDKSIYYYEYNLCNTGRLIIITIKVSENPKFESRCVYFHYEKKNSCCNIRELTQLVTVTIKVYDDPEFESRCV